MCKTILAEDREATFTKELTELCRQKHLITNVKDGYVIIQTQTFIENRKFKL